MQFLRLGELLGCLFLLSKLRVQPRETVMCIGLRRIQLDGMLKSSDRFLISVLIGIDATKIEVSQPVFILQLKRFLSTTAQPPRRHLYAARCPPDINRPEHIPDCS